MAVDTSKKSGYGRNEVAEALDAMPLDIAIDKGLDALEKLSERCARSDKAYLAAIFGHLARRMQQELAHERARLQVGHDPMGDTSADKGSPSVRPATTTT